MNATIAMQRLPLMRLFQRVRRLITGWRASRAPAELACAQEGTPEEQDAPRACGWFDSSHDLQQGLRVQEHLSAESLVRELPLGAWLDLQLSGWRAATPAAGQAAFTHAT
jgi:hypothetical protein